MTQASTDSPANNGGHAEANGHSPKTFWTLALGSMGVVYGDIGTSPLYAFKVALVAAGDETILARDNVLGVLSLILWALILVVTVKYVLILLRADNKGEGGTLSLMALAQRTLQNGKARTTVMILGMIAAALFYGDALITPAISVISAVEGLEVVSPRLETYVVPLTIVILFGLFAVQSRGTALVAAYFGPIMMVWFAMLAGLGIWHIADDPSVIAALNPYWAIDFFIDHGLVALLTLGAVFLSVTGAEALYADLGHFGRKPIQTAWLFFVLPAWCSTISARARWCFQTPRRSMHPSTSWCPPGASTPSSSWPHWRP
ncbi:potassium transport protein Kup [Methyloligella halotolerans]|uniref:Potassium transport protein Kup n=1 Tax=Methyloligella halotolerans TaxID=1177755 RepID=A0A1E2S3R7_9HYPH|nr:potassium transport protein Kup [Methyloligella halotolerans]